MCVCVGLYVCVCLCVCACVSTTAVCVKRDVTASLHHRCEADFPPRQTERRIPTLMILGATRKPSLTDRQIAGRQTAESTVGVAILTSELQHELTHT